MSYTLIEAIVEEHNRQEAIRAGEPPWDPNEYDPYADDPDSSPNQDHFFAYGHGLGLSQETLRAEWEMQINRGGDPRRLHLEVSNGTGPSGVSG